MGVTVKPLVWYGQDGRGVYITYTVVSVSGGCWIVYRHGHVMGGVLHGAYQQVYATEEAAREAAQADYDAIILSAIEVSP